MQTTNNLFSSNSDEQEPNRTCRIVTTTLLSLLVIPCSAGAAALGAYFLKHRDENYDPGAAAANAALGCTILSIALLPLALGISGRFKRNFKIPSGEGGYLLFFYFLAIFPLFAAGGALGSAVLQSNMSAGTSAAAAALGGSVFAAMPLCLQCSYSAYESEPERRWLPSL